MEIKKTPDTPGCAAGIEAVFGVLTEVAPNILDSSLRSESPYFSMEIYISMIGLILFG